jgi:hypothetical protein
MFSNVEHELNGGSEIWVTVPGNGTSANIEHNDQRDTRQPRQNDFSSAAFQRKQ